MSTTNEGIMITTETDDDDNVTYIYQLTVVNNAGVELPSTGGPGTSLISLLGFLLAGFAGAGLVMRRVTKRQAV